jgi:hypothetical protein
MSKKYKYTRMMQRGGDDGYCWCVEVKINGVWREKINGCVRMEADSFRRQFEREEEAKVAAREDATLSAKKKYDIEHDGVVHSPGPDGTS